MTPEKLTDEQIIKDLPKILFGGHGCRKCKFYSLGGDERCGVKGCIIARNALDLINHLKADNERMINSGYALDIRTVKTEAYKEFAERLKEKKRIRCVGHGDYDYAVDVYDIDRVYDEMVNDE